MNVGDTILFEQPLSFENGKTAAAFRVVEWGRRKRFLALTPQDETFLCRIDRWTLRNGKYEILAA